MFPTFHIIRSNLFPSILIFEHSNVISLGYIFVSGISELLSCRRGWHRSQGPEVFLLKALDCYNPVLAFPSPFFFFFFLLDTDLMCAVGAGGFEACPRHPPPAWPPSWGLQGPPSPSDSIPRSPPPPREGVLGRSLGRQRLHHPWSEKEVEEAQGGKSCIPRAEPPGTKPVSPQRSFQHCSQGSDPLPSSPSPAQPFAGTGPLRSCHGGVVGPARRGGPRKRGGVGGG